MTPPPVNSGYNPSGADDTTDAWDTIDWLVKNVPESNGRVGMIGSSYEGFTVVMALLSPHPALKVAAPESPMVDGWMGDDWFHYGAFRQPNIDYVLGQTSRRGEGVAVPHLHRDDYTNYLDAGSANDFAKSEGVDQLPFWSSSTTPPTTASGKARLSTISSSSARSPFRPCGSRASGTRKTCGAPSTATAPSKRKIRPPI
jgi:hypothetical protein